MTRTTDNSALKKIQDSERQIAWMPRISLLEYDRFVATVKECLFVDMSDEYNQLLISHQVTFLPDGNSKGNQYHLFEYEYFFYFVRAESRYENFLKNEFIIGEFEEKRDQHIFRDMMNGGENDNYITSNFALKINAITRWRMKFG